MPEGRANAAGGLERRPSAMDDKLLADISEIAGTHFVTWRLLALHLHRYIGQSSNGNPNRGYSSYILQLYTGLSRSALSLTRIISSRS